MCFAHGHIHSNTCCSHRYQALLVFTPGIQSDRITSSIQVENRVDSTIAWNIASSNIGIRTSNSQVTNIGIIAQAINGTLCPCSESTSCLVLLISRTATPVL